MEGQSQIAYFSQLKSWHTRLALMPNTPTARVTFRGHGKRKISAVSFHLSLSAPVKTVEVVSFAVLKAAQNSVKVIAVECVFLTPKNHQKSRIQLSLSILQKNEIELIELVYWLPPLPAS